MIGGLILAAGGGTRLGGRKQLAQVGGRAMLDRVLEAMTEARLDRLVVVLGHEAGAVREAMGFRGAEVVVCERWEEGQSASLRAGLDALAGCGAAVVVLGDQPFLSPRAVERVVAARSAQADAVRATYGGVPGHPVVLERSLFHRVTGLEGDVGARAILGQARVVEVPCDGHGRPDDVDTHEELEAAAGRMSRGAPDRGEEAIRR